MAPAVDNVDQKLDNGERMTTSEVEISPREQRLREAAGRRLAKLRWAGTTPEQRSEAMTQVAAARTPEQMGAARRSDKPRCPCGAMTAVRAQARAHHCEPPKKTKRG